MVSAIKVTKGVENKSDSPGFDPEIIRSMQRITLQETENVRLMNRMDTKYQLSVDGLNEILHHVASDYDVVVIDGNRIASYRTIYYDTPSLHFFHEHVNGKLNRHKVRVRSYLECDLHFLEVKQKLNTGKVKKIRIEIKDDPVNFGQEACDMVKKYTGDDLFLLFPSLTDSFKRITLVNKSRTERITIDFDLSFHKPGVNQWISLPKLAIIEIKQDKTCFSCMGDALLTARVKKSGISKYCLGISVTDPGEKLNNFKQTLRNLQKITNYELIT